MGFIQEIRINIFACLGISLLIASVLASDKVIQSVQRIHLICKLVAIANFIVFLTWNFSQNLWKITIRAHSIYCLEKFV